MSTAPTATIRPSGDAFAEQVWEQRLVARRALRAVLGTTPDEEDLIQEVLARLVVRLRQPGDIALSAWTWRVAHNIAIDYLRARRAVPTDPALLDSEVGAGVDDEVLASQLAAAVEEGLARLPDRQRRALAAHARLDGGRGGHALVAAELGVSDKAAESILARARHALRRELGQWVAVGTFVGWVRRAARRMPHPKAVAMRAALVATVVGGTAGAVMMTLPTAPHDAVRPAPSGVATPVPHAPKGASRSHEAAASPAGSLAVPSIPSLPLASLFTVPALPLAPAPVHLLVPSITVGPSVPVVVMQPSVSLPPVTIGPVSVPPPAAPALP